MEALAQQAQELDMGTNEALTIHGRLRCLCAVSGTFARFLDVALGLSGQSKIKSRWCACWGSFVTANLPFFLIAVCY